MLIPLVFGLGALIGTNIGARQPARALRIALTGGALVFVLTEAIGLGAAVWPLGWFGRFGRNLRMLATVALLRLAGAGRLLSTLCCSFIRLIIAIGGRWLVVRLPGSLTWLFVALALGLVVYGVTIAASAIASGVPFSRSHGSMPPR